MTDSSLEGLPLRHFGRYRDVRERKVELLGIIPSLGQSVLDAGCGLGTYGIILARKGNMEAVS